MTNKSFPQSLHHTQTQWLVYTYRDLQESSWSEFMQHIGKLVANLQQKLWYKCFSYHITRL